MRETAKRIGIPESTYREWEYGRAIRGEPYPEIAKAFEIPLAELFGINSAKNESVEEIINRITEDLATLKKKLAKQSG